MIQSPVHDWLAAHGAKWSRCPGLAAHLGEPSAERVAGAELALCDLSALPKLGLKGDRSADWLAGQGIAVPGARYETGSLSDGGLIARTDAHEFFLQGGPGASVVPKLDDLLRASPVSNPLHVERSDAVLALLGRRADRVLLETCGLNPRKLSKGHLVMTRVAGVSCALLPETFTNTTGYRLWLDPTLAVSLWESVEEIVRDLGGSVVGAGCVYPGLTPG